MSTSGTIDRKKVTDRRPLSFRTMQDIAADIRELGDDDGVLRVSGNWTAAQILGHVTFFIEGALDGIDIQAPLHFRLLGRLFKKGAVSKPIKPGFNMPSMMAAVATPSAESTWTDAVEHFRSTIARIEAGERMTRPSPVFGPMTHDEWEQLHCRHAEMHFSFIHRGD